MEWAEIQKLIADYKEEKIKIFDGYDKGDCVIYKDIPARIDAKFFDDKKGEYYLRIRRQRNSRRTVLTSWEQGGTETTLYNTAEGLQKIDDPFDGVLQQELLHELKNTDSISHKTSTESKLIEIYNGCLHKFPFSSDRNDEYVCEICGCYIDETGKFQYNL